MKHCFDFLMLLYQFFKGNPQKLNNTAIQIVQQSQLMFKQHNMKAFELHKSFENITGKEASWYLPCRNQ